MTNIDNAEKKAMACLNGWVDAMVPKFNAIEMQDLKRRMISYFREYESKIAEEESLKRAFEEGSAEWEADYKNAALERDRLRAFVAKVSKYSHCSDPAIVLEAKQVLDGHDVRYVEIEKLKEQRDEWKKTAEEYAITQIRQMRKIDSLNAQLATLLESKEL